MAFRVLAIDGGKTKTDAALFEDDQLIRSSRGGGAENVKAPGGLAAIRRSLEQATDGLLSGESLDVVSIGLTSVFAPSVDAEAILDLLNQLFDADRYAVTSDMVTAYCGAMGIEPGAVIAAGTGSIGFAVNSAGETARVDGWGYLLGDAGSGYEIGQRGLRAVLRSADGRDTDGSATRLASLAAERFGDVQAVTGHVYGAELPAQVVASFAADVLLAAAESDPVAVEICEAAGRELAVTVATASRRVRRADDRATVSWTGGLLSPGSALLASFLRQLDDVDPMIEPRDPLSSPLDGAALLGQNLDAPLLQQVVAVRPGGGDGD